MVADAAARSSVGDTATMTAPTSPPGSPGPVWTAAAVARRLGVAPGTLRSWSRRYGIGPAAHTPGRNRRYTAADLAELDAMRALVAQGMVLSAAAAIVRNQRVHTTGDSDATAARAAPSDPSSAADPVVALAGAAARLDAAAITTVLTTSLTEHGVITTWDRLCRPAFARLDVAVVGDLGCTDAQLLLSWAITTCLRRFPVAPPAQDRPVLLACTAEEHHALPLEALSAALAERQVPAAMLGPAVPAAALLHSAQHLRPSAVVIWSHRAATATPAVLASLHPHTDAVIAAGPGWQHVAIGPAVLTADTLQVALALATHSTTATRQPL